MGGEICVLLYHKMMFDVVLCGSLTMQIQLEIQGQEIIIQYYSFKLFLYFITFVVIQCTAHAYLCMNSLKIP